MLKNALPDNEYRKYMYSLISCIPPFDPLEENQIDETLDWIRSGDPICRIHKPDFPHKHLVSYFVLFDEIASQILLVDHKKAQLWLPAGGHVDINEDPKETVRRECMEELNISPLFFTETPFFLSSSVTVGLTAGHTDVSLWYLLKGHHKDQYVFDEREFNSIKWFDLSNIPYDKADPHLRRFVQKLATVHCETGQNLSF